ncbi:S9 family peptidase [Streptomyces sp. WAC05374]|uniref:prolyl oligopeptidase family serine peptidase n=1 Tax=Streptomyces sp. WAC05374 TaxID=2487420 RepID=UPI000F898382|nr:prolyl oligopeptidase family serine peptidase [Streptomyces sp. WAC05374]RST19204.1 S9 family peptidase [Streptomyces sp. WAC05374]TDF50465.1 S9 family peptidase [Streptomyces sp. WAC05374]TDF51832.1 S9 family peptidase [Streptomyces sp. WAC05374]TDF60718.1 S9 family peptidase [Streptomyces sp. WAC05374]
MAADAQDHLTGTTSAAPLLVPLAGAAGLRDTPQPLVSHGCWYPSADPTGERVAFICDRTGVPQLWTGPAHGTVTADGGGIHLLDADPDPVTEVAWSPDGRWIAYTVAPGGGEHTRVLCVRPDGTGRRIVAGADAGSSAYLGCWARDGSAVAVTVAEPPPSLVPPAPEEVAAEERDAFGELPADWAERDGQATLLGGAHRGEVGPGPREAGVDGAVRDRLSAYLVDPDGVRSPVLVAAESGAATLRVCDVSQDGRLALVRRGPRGRREAVVVRTADLGTGSVLRVADGDPWIGRFSPDGRTVWLRSDHGREFAALLAAGLDEDGGPSGLSVLAERDGCDLELLAFAEDGRTAALAWNVRGASELSTLGLPAAAGPAAPAPSGGATGTAPPHEVALPHEVVTRISRAGPGGMVLALAGSQRKPGVWWVSGTASPTRTPWSSRDDEAVPPGRPPVRPAPLRPTARDGLVLGGWYYRAPGRAEGRPAPCVIHLHGGPEEQERPVFEPLYHELTGRGLDVFAPDVRGSSGYGRSFVDADLGTGRYAAIQDVADCAAHAVLTGRADPTRLAVMGRSYGGYLTLASLVWHPELFRTGVAVCGMSDFATFFAGTEPWIAESAAHKYGHPVRDRELLRSLSPMSRIDELRVPLLAVHGEHDTNVPPGESEQVVRAARERGHAAELLTLREEGHEFRRADNRRLFRRTAADWMERHLTG